MDMNKKSQAATEYLMIIGFVMVILIPGIYLYIQYSNESNDSVINAKVDSMTNEIVKAAEQVYSYGEGSLTTLNINVPKNVVSISFEGNEVIFTVLNSKGIESEIVKASNVKLNGYITILEGSKMINIISYGDEVLVYVSCDSAQNRCGEEWECNKYVEGYEEEGCIMTCEDNRWMFNYDNLCTNGCTEGTCDACTEGTRCGTPQECNPSEECLVECNAGEWEVIQQCSEQGLVCEGDQCVVCENFDLKCGEGPECLGAPEDQCILKCQNNIWAVETQCTYPNIDCVEQGPEVFLCVPECDPGESKCGIGNECELGEECTLTCDNDGKWIEQQCLSPTNTCKLEFGIATCTTECEDAEQKCGTQEECQENGGFYPCILSCNNGEWSANTCPPDFNCIDNPPPMCVL